MKRAGNHLLIVRNMLLFTGFLCAAGCSSIKVASQKDPAVDLGQYRTFDWTPTSPSEPVPNVLLDKQLRYSVQADMAKVGVQRAQPGVQPDFFIAYSVNTQNVATSEGGVGLGIGIGVLPGVGVGVSAPVGAQTNVKQYSTLTLAFIDSRNRGEIWRSTATTPLEGEDQSQEALKSVIEKMVDDFEHDRKKSG